ncbi:hypothetical protein KVH31_34405 [Streptomyces olivaceus]|uniref:hypothetical protein n=1 Tax=Streptomyces olivaceus TaxID=47716 RepID=UPI001CC95DFC|nr:hypothetical protein [Streptomyces olivaceus]MBZ6211589.1 hypothetical protein [Streptomyces olivaceus]
MNSEAPAFDTHPHYRTPCSLSHLTATLGKRRAREIRSHYPDGLTLADLSFEQAIDADNLTLLDGAWGPKSTPIALAADFGLRLADLVVSNGVARGFISEQEAQQQYVTIGRHPSEWRAICDADTLRMHHRNRVFVLSETPEAFGLTVLWEIGYSIGDLNLGTGPEAFEQRTTAAMAAEMSTAPFTPDQVAALHVWQQGETAVRCKAPECSLTDQPVLEASAAGLTCPRCGEVRSWAWRAMTGEDVDV